MKVTEQSTHKARRLIEDRAPEGIEKERTA